MKSDIKTNGTLIGVPFVAYDFVAYNLVGLPDAYPIFGCNPHAVAFLDIKGFIKFVAVDHHAVDARLFGAVYICLRGILTVFAAGS